MANVAYGMPLICELRYRIALCTMHDVVSENGHMLLRRKEIAKLWAKIESIVGVPPYLSPLGFNIMTGVDVASHRIWLRARARLDVTSAAWCFEERRASAPRWYKVLGVSDDREWVCLNTKLMEASDNAVAPAGLLSAEPSDIAL